MDGYTVLSQSLHVLVLDTSLYFYLVPFLTFVEEDGRENDSKFKLVTWKLTKCTISLINCSPIKSISQTTRRPYTMIFMWLALLQHLSYQNIMATTDNPHFLVYVSFSISLMVSAIALDANSSNSGATIKCIESEKQALLKLKSGLVDHHNQLSSWGSDSDQDCCRWERVRCHNESGRVQVLNLRPEIDINETYIFGTSPRYASIQPDGEYNVAFGGVINSSLIELKYLKHLDLSLFGGTFDFDLNLMGGSLKELRYLNLSWCHLGGPISNQFGNLSRLISLDLSHNGFRNIVSLAWVSRLPRLKYLDMSYVNLSHATDWLQSISNLPSLLSLTLTQSELAMAPTIPDLTHANYSTSLEAITLVSNSLTSSIFPWISNFNNSLVHLDLRDNELQGRIPEAVGGMVFLEYFNLVSNGLAGEIPRSLERLSRLERLLLAYNNLTGEFPDMKNFSALVEVSVAFNKLSGNLPESTWQLSNLESLALMSNSMSGVISDTNLANLSKLKQLILTQNSFTLDLSAEWIPPFQLQILALGSCRLGPNLPRWLLTQHQLVVLEISNSGISDVISSWFWELPVKLVHLDLSGNHISGELHNLSSILSDFSTVLLSSNDFHGPIPLLPPNVTQLNLSKNKLSGSASNLCSITGGELSYLDLSYNFLSGELPDCWNQWRNLSVISLANNNFSGSIPPSIGSLLNIQTLHLRNNSFTGELPPFLGNCAQLELLDVGENKLSGQIPEWIGTNLSSLIILRLRSNHFYGTIPLQLCHLDYIQILDISNNNILGNIPGCLRNFSAMARRGGAIETFFRNVTYPIGPRSFIVVPYVDNIQVVWKGMELEYGKTLGLVKSLDLSRNNLSGEIPIGITSLLGIVALNLSYNQLTGTIPRQIGQLDSLQSLDLSMNYLSGGIPEELGGLNFLSHLNLSYNNLSGKIPTSTHLQSLDSTSFRGNAELCGQPLPDCPPPSTDQSRKNVGPPDEEDELFGRGFYVSIGVGFGVGFWGIGVSLLLHRPWRHAYFRFLDHIDDQLYVALVLNFSKLKRRLFI